MANPLILLVPEVGIEPTRTQSSDDLQSHIPVLINCL